MFGTILLTVKKKIADIARIWTARDTVRDWVGCASSSDGNYLVAVSAFDQIQTSSNGGATWVTRRDARNWIACASSADGNKLMAVDSYGLVYTSA